MNAVQISGYMANDPVVKYSGENNQTPSARFSVAVRSGYKNAEGNYDADFLNVSCWNNTAKFVENYFHKGDYIEISGKLRSDKYTNKSGVTVQYVEIRANEVGFGGRSSSGGDNGNAQSGGNTGNRNNYNGNNNNYGGNNGQNFINIPEGVDESLPFN